MIDFKRLLSELRNPSEIKQFRKQISHIKAVDSRDPTWQGSLPSLFAKYGFKSVGSGKYATVFAHPRYPYVVKVFMRDSAYLRWLNFAKNNQNNPWVPKIKGKVVRIGNVFMAVRLEKLTYLGSGGRQQLYTADEKGDKDAIKVVDFLESNSKLLDLHGGNIMYRGNQPVVIDPFYNWYKGGMFAIDPDDMSEFKKLF